MARRYQYDKNKSQIVFDITGGEKKLTTMTMNTLPKERVIIRNRNENFSLKTEDIEGAKPKPPNKGRGIDFFYPDDIQGTHPESKINLNKNPTDILNVKDIPGATPKIQRSLPHSERHTNPLNPTYELPQKEEEPIPIPKFIRDQSNFDDLPGNHPKSYKPTKPAKNLLDTTDIPGSTPKQLIKKFEGNRTLDVTDINTGGIFKSTRNTNPLNPSYYFDGHELEQDFGIKHSNYLDRKDNKDLSLTTSDITGATADSSTLEYRTFRRINYKDLDEDNNELNNTMLILPSMEKQTLEIEKQKQSDKIRGEKIRQFENRHLQFNTGGNDKTQSFLRNHREDNNKRRNNVTFQIDQ